MRPSVLLPTLGVAATPFLLEIFVTHPHVLTPETVAYQHTLRLVLLVVFPLLGVHLWQFIYGLRDMLSWAARALAFVQIVFYSALNVLAGIGTGLLVIRQPGNNSPELSRAMGLLFTQGNALSQVERMGLPGRVCVSERGPLTTPEPYPPGVSQLLNDEVDHIFPDTGAVYRRW